MRNASQKPIDRLSRSVEVETSYGQYEDSLLWNTTIKYNGFSPQYKLHKRFRGEGEIIDAENSICKSREYYYLGMMDNILIRSRNQQDLYLAKAVLEENIEDIRGAMERGDIKSKFPQPKESAIKEYDITCLAAYSNNSEVMNTLIQNGIAVDPRALKIAKTNGNEETYKFLLKYYLSPSAETRYTKGSVPELPREDVRRYIGNSLVKDYMKTNNKEFYAFARIGAIGGGVLFGFFALSTTTFLATVGTFGVVAGICYKNLLDDRTKTRLEYTLKTDLSVIYGKAASATTSFVEMINNRLHGDRVGRESSYSGGYRS